MTFVCPCGHLPRLIGRTISFPFCPAGALAMTKCPDGSVRMKLRGCSSTTGHTHTPTEDCGHISAHFLDLWTWNYASPCWVSTLPVIRETTENISRKKGWHHQLPLRGKEEEEEGRRKEEEEERGGAQRSAECATAIEGNVMMREHFKHTSV